MTRFNYSYDELGRLTSDVSSTTTDDVHWTTDWTNSFTYDRYANMLTNVLAPGGTTTLAVNAANNRLSSYTTSQGTTNVSYDLAGNMITEGAKSYTFNAASQLKSMTGPSGSQGTYRFDAMGNRVKRTWNYQSGSTWSGSLIAIYGPGGELLTEYKNETNSVYGETTTTYHIQMSGQTVARRVIGTNIYGGPASRTEWLHRNPLNQVVAVDSVNDSNQSVFGRIAGYSQPYNSGGSDQFQGHKDDPETSLHYNLARSYSPAMARWISADPVTSRPYNPKSLNKYAYVRNDSVNHVDPDGDRWISNGEGGYDWVEGIDVGEPPRGGGLGGVDVGRCAGGELRRRRLGW